MVYLNMVFGEAHIKFEVVDSGVKSGYCGEQRYHNKGKEWAVKSVIDWVCDVYGVELGDLRISKE